MENPANGLKDLMWSFLMDRGQKENIPALKEAVYRLIQITTQKTAGQRKKTGIHSYFLGYSGHGTDEDGDRGNRIGCVGEAGGTRERKSVRCQEQERMPQRLNELGQQLGIKLVF